MNIVGFFEEKAGQKSMMRLQSFMMLMFFFAANASRIATCMHLAIVDKPVPPMDTNTLWFECLVLCFAFFPKVAQKLIEMKFNIPATDSKTDSSTQP